MYIRFYRVSEMKRMIDPIMGKIHFWKKFFDSGICTCRINSKLIRDNARSWFDNSNDKRLGDEN
jgi:hypothetical protein